MTIENQSNHKYNAIYNPNHSPNTIHWDHMGILGYPAQVYGLSTEGVASHHLIIPVIIRLE